MRMAFYVVSTCAAPMIIFSGLGVAISAMLIRMMTGEWKNPLRRVDRKDVPLSHRFQVWLFVVTSSILISTIVFSYIMQTGSAVQTAQNTIEYAVDDIRHTYEIYEANNRQKVLKRGESISTDAKSVATIVEQVGSLSGLNQSQLDRLCKMFELTGIGLYDADGSLVGVSGFGSLYQERAQAFLKGGADSTVFLADDGQLAAMIRCMGGAVLISTDPNTTDISEELSGDSFIHVGLEGTFDVFSADGTVTMGSHAGETLSSSELSILNETGDGKYFRGSFFGAMGYCRVDTLKTGARLLLRLPLDEVYLERDIQMHETVLADILLFTVVYVLISLLVQTMVVNNLKRINVLLAKITGGDLNVVVDVHSAAEFTALSGDINQTVDTLKGYIEAAEKRIEQELEFARTIQDSALPKNFAVPRNEFEIFALMDPAKEIGGDFYDFFFIDQNKVALVIADVSGKGIPAALFMMRAKTAVRGLAETGSTPAEIMYRA
ncbi:MAG: SpoIIE family protein phosphatase, partial [Clostridia bacterium]|nr:SpoIIE family protein phosphatase [Clostridia bacterium]